MKNINTNLLSSILLNITNVGKKCNGFTDYFNNLYQEQTKPENIINMWFQYQSKNESEMKTKQIKKNNQSKYFINPRGKIGFCDRCTILE